MVIITIVSMTSGIICLIAGNWTAGIYFIAFLLSCVAAEIKLAVKNDPRYQEFHQ
jgi:hypothetical protein